MPPLGIGAAGASGIALYLGDGVAVIVREEVAFAEIRLKHFLAVPIDVFSSRGRLLARVAAGAVLGEHNLAALQYRLVGGEVLLSAGRVLQPERFEAREELAHIGELLLRGQPIHRVLLRRADFKGLLPG